MSITTVWQALLSGLLNGAVYGLLSVGLTMIFGVVKIVNFAHGEFLMIGMYVSYALWAFLGIDPLWSLPLVMAALFFFGMGIQRFFIRRVLNAPDLAQIFLTVGLSVLMINLALFLFRADFRMVKVPYADWTFSLAGAIVSVPRLIACLGAIIFSLLLALFLLKTDVGKAMRAVAQDREVSMLVGINPERMYNLAVGISLTATSIRGTGIMSSCSPPMNSTGVRRLASASGVAALSTSRSRARRRCTSSWVCRPGTPSWLRRRICL